MNTIIQSPEAGHEKKLLAKITELENKKYLPVEMMSLVAEVVKLQSSVQGRVSFSGGRDELPSENMQNCSEPEKRFAGIPILQGKYFPLDMESIRFFAKDLLRIVPIAAPQLAVYASALGAMFEGDDSLLEKACHEVLDPSLEDKDMPCLGAWAKEHPDAPHFYRFVVTSAAMPSLSLAGRILGKQHDSEKVWAHGHCPVCGNQPLIGRLDGKEGRRMHTCSFCSFEFRVPRLGCPFCLASESEGSEYYVSSDEPGYLLNVCDSCKNYFKLGDFREFDRYWQPMLDDLASITLDLYARQMGYTRPTLSGWGF